MRRAVLAAALAAFALSAQAKSADPQKAADVSVDQVKAALVFARAEAAGATIEQPLEDHGYGLTCTIRDLDGHPWFFTQAPES